MPSSSADRVLQTAERRAAGRDIGTHPPPKNPKRRKKCTGNLLAFCRTYFPQRFELEFSEDHVTAIKLLQSAVLDGGQFAVAMPRGSGKTTICEVACIWAILNGHRRFVFVVASDAAAAESICSNLRAELDGNDLLAEDYPDAVHGIRALEGIARRAEGQTSNGERTYLIWTKNEVRLPNTAAGGGSVIRTAGITGRIRGAKAPLSDGSQVRPDLVLVDDPQTDESARSPSQVAARLKTLTNSVLGLGGPDKKIACLVTCTVIEKGDLADQLLDRRLNPQWQGFKCSLMHSMPANVPLWDQYGEILREDMRTESGTERATAFYATHRKAMDEGAVAAWPQRHAPDELSAIQHAMSLRIVRGEAAFQAEYQNTPSDPFASGEVQQITTAAVLKKLNNHERGLVPLDDTLLTAGIDVQRKALFHSIAAWNPAFGGDVIAYGAFPDQGRPYFTLQEIQKTMEAAHPGASWEAALYASLEQAVEIICGQEWRRDDGSVGRVEQVLIDAGYGESTNTVYKFCRASKYSAILLPSFGRAVAAGALPLDEWKKKPGDRVGSAWRIPKPAARQTRHCLFDANRWKSFVADRLLALPGSAASLGLYGKRPGEHRMLADHLASEIRTRVAANGRVSDEWKKKPNTENHWLDTIALSAVAASIRGCKLDEKAAIIRAEAPTEKANTNAPTTATTTTTTKAPAFNPKPPPPRPRLRPTGGNWLAGYGAKL